jgi:capsular exopolysaccharide synthesis family protein
VDLGERPPVNARIVERAAPPDRPYKPNLRKNLLLATAAGLCLALGLTLFLEYWESTIDTPEQLRRRFNIPYLGHVPTFVPSHRSSSRWPWTRREKTPLGELYVALPLRQDEVLDAVQRAIAERFRMIRTVLVSSNNPSRTIMVTSPDAQSGKTFVACNLALSLAQLDKRVLLVDCDLRVPRLHEVFGLASEIGMFDFLTTEELLPTAFQPTEHPRLHVLTAGKNRDFPAERLSSPALRKTIEGLARFYDYVVLDSAPLLPVPDSVSLAKCCEEVVLVVRSRYTTEASLQAALDIIGRSNARITGVVLNDLDTRSASTPYAAYEYGTSGKT